MHAELAHQLAVDGVTANNMTFARAGDLRYVGQGYELRVALPGGPLDGAAMAAVFQRFGELHRSEYGHVFASPVEIVNIRVTGVGRMPKIGAPPPLPGGSVAEALVRTAQCAFRFDGKLQAMATQFYRRELLPLGETIAGPAIVLQTDSTTVVPPATTLTAGSDGNLILRLEE